MFYGLISTGAALMNDRLYPDCRFELKKNINLTKKSRNAQG